MSKKNQKESTPIADFEKSMQELEKLVEQMEQGKLSLDETLQCFERGVQLTNLCQKALSDAEQRVEQLQKNTGSNEEE